MNKTAIVLAGGGSRGAYQIGVWKALREMGIDYQLVTRTSVGALKGVQMASLPPCWMRKNFGSHRSILRW